MPERERIDTGTDKRYVRRDDKGQFDDSVDVGRSHRQDQQRDSRKDNPGSEGDRGDRRKATANGGNHATQGRFQVAWARLDRAWAPNGPWRW
jgi:hypothetical protein